jgi:hypothetical protein
MGFISIRVADFTAGSPDLMHPPPLPGLGTDYVETTRESLPVNLVFQSKQRNGKIQEFLITGVWNA